MMASTSLRSQKKIIVKVFCLRLPPDPSLAALNEQIEKALLVTTLGLGLIDGTPASHSIDCLCVCVCVRACVREALLKSVFILFDTLRYSL